MSILIKLDSQNMKAGDTSDNFSTYFSPALNLKNDVRDWEFALIQTTMWYNFYNVSASIGNNVLKYSNNSGSNWYTVTIPDGLYSIENINSQIQQAIENNGHTVNKLKIIANYSIVKVQIYIEPGSNFQIDLQSSVSSFGSFLGFNSAIYTTEGYSTAQNNANITNDINKLIVHCSLVNNEFSFDNGTKSDTLFTVVPNELPGSLMVREPSKPIYLPVNNTFIERISMRVTDERNNRINFNGENVTYLLHLRKIKH